MWALGTVYGENIVTCGPLPAGDQVAANKIIISFKHTEGGLRAQGGALRGFVIAGSDQRWKDADAKIVGDTVIVSHPDVTKPLAVRYAWSNNPECNLYNGADLPASPFRTDEWP
jgi:sialate O-acetylesterase